MSGRFRITAAASLAAVCLAAAGCGKSKDDGDPIPGSIVSALSEQLTGVQNRVDFAKDNPGARGAGACDDIENKSFPAIEDELAKVPDGVAQDVRDALNESFDNLHNLARSTCDQVQKESTNTDTTPTETIPTETVAPPPTETTPTETTPTQTTPPPKKPKQPKQKPNQEQGGQGTPGNGNGNGGGAGAPPGKGGD